MSPVRMMYLALTVWGAIHPMYYFVTWFNSNSYDIMAMVELWLAALFILEVPPRSVTVTCRESNLAARAL